MPEVTFVSNVARRRVQAVPVVGTFPPDTVAICASLLWYNCLFEATAAFGGYVITFKCSALFSTLKLSICLLPPTVLVNKKYSLEPVSIATAGLTQASILKAGPRTISRLSALLGGSCTFSAPVSCRPWLYRTRGLPVYVDLYWFRRSVTGVSSVLKGWW